MIIFAKVNGSEVTTSRTNLAVNFKFAVSVELQHGNIKTKLKSFKKKINLVKIDRFCGAKDFLNRALSLFYYLQNEHKQLFLL